MNLNEYQQQALTTALFTDDDFQDLIHWVLGITGEAGEIAEKLKKIVRDKNGAISDQDKEDFIKEMGDVLWYLAVMANHLGYEFNEVGARNLAKLSDRKKRDAIKGSGDNR